METRWFSAIAIASITLSAATLVVATGPANAGCIASPITGGLQVDCSADVPPDPVNVPILIPAGNNILNVGGGGYLSFDILGNGSSVTTYAGGATSAGITTGNGADQFTMSGGSIGSTVSQGDGVDGFTMSAGSVGAVDQGGGLDNFFMSGGTIVGAFNDGDFATITGGSIGSIDMNVGNNELLMTGGIVVGNVVARQNNDTFVLSGGTIGGRVDLGNGTNRITVSGTTIGNGVTTGLGTDTFIWSGGAITGAISLGGGTDHATLRNLDSTQLANTTLVDGGAAADTLTISNSAVSGIARFVNWETVALTSASTVTLDSDLVLGDAGTGTGALTIDATSTLYAGGGNFSITPFTSGQLVEVTSAGLVDLASGSVGDTLSILGNFVGRDGRLRLDTQLGGDGSPSDQLIIDGGAATGSTGIVINNVGGAGAKTVADGILVIETQNGGTTSSGAFSLAAPAIAGPYEYTLYRGAADGAAPDNWYLRSTLDCGPNSNLPVCGPNLRSETSLYAAVPAMTLLYGRLMLDTLHERRGDEVRADESAPNAVWGRVIGQHGDRDGSSIGVYGTGPEYDYDFWAFQGGADLYRDGSIGTSRNLAGAFFAIGNGSGDVQHVVGNDAGENSFMAYSLGGYWTHYTPENGYVDALLLGTWYDVDAKSNRIDKMTTNGAAFGASLEGGYPVFAGAGGFKVEPQAQIAFQTIDLHNGSDAAAQVHFDDVNSLAGRVGVRFAQDLGPPGSFTAWVRPNVWYEFLGDPKTQFSSAAGFIPFAAELGGTTLEINTGFTADVGGGAAIYANASYLVGLSESADGNAYDGKLGLKIGW